jgi:hypothetical protein
MISMTALLTKKRVSHNVNIGKTDNLKGGAALHVVGWYAGPPGVEGLSDTYGVLRINIKPARPAVKKKNATLWYF